MIINLTPHVITIVGCTAPHDDPPSALTIQSSGLARAYEIVEPGEPIDGIPTTHVRYGAVQGLPEPRPGTWYVVSTIAATAAKQSGRSVRDLLVPGQAVRDERGQVIGCRSLCRVASRELVIGDLVMVVSVPLIHEGLCHPTGSVGRLIDLDPDNYEGLTHRVEFDFRDKVEQLCTWYRRDDLALAQSF